MIELYFKYKSYIGMFFFGFLLAVLGCVVVSFPMPIGSVIAAVVLACVYNSKAVEENAHYIDICLIGYLIMVGVSLFLDMPISFVMSKCILIQSFLGGLFCGLLHDKEIKDIFDKMVIGLMFGILGALPIISLPVILWHIATAAMIPTLFMIIIAYFLGLWFYLLF